VNKERKNVEVKPSASHETTLDDFAPTHAFVISLNLCDPKEI
jgi:hypothetical protein